MGIIKKFKKKNKMSSKNMKILVKIPSEEKIASTAYETDGFTSSVHRDKELNENFRKMFEMSTSEQNSKTTSRSSSRRSSLMNGEVPHYMKSTKCIESRAVEPRRKSAIIAPQALLEIVQKKEKKPTKSVSKEPVKKGNEKSMDDYLKVVQGNIKSCKNLLDANK